MLIAATNILFAGYDFEMVWVATRTIAAQMIDLVTIRDFTDEYCPHQPMNKPALAPT